MLAASTVLCHLPQRPSYRPPPPLITTVMLVLWHCYHLHETSAGHAGLHPGKVVSRATGNVFSTEVDFREHVGATSREGEATMEG